MTLAELYLLCFLVGLALTVVSALIGGTHFHLPHIHVHHGGLGHVHTPHGGGGGRRSTVGVVNFGTVTAFFAWFGGAGYLMTRYYGPWLWAGVLVAVLVGLAGAAVVIWFVSGVLVSEHENLDPADYEMVGVLGRLTSPIRAGGIGELMFSKQGTRRTAGARSEDGTAIPKDTEVIVTRYERGIAYVRTWESAMDPPIGRQRVER